MMSNGVWVVKRQTPIETTVTELKGFCQPRQRVEKFFPKAANTNLPGELFRGAPHNSWAIALVGESFVTFQNEKGVTEKVLPITAFRGVTAVVSYPNDEVTARLVLEHKEENWSIYLTQPLDGDDFGRAWEAWLEALDLPAILKQRKDEVLKPEGGAVNGSIMPNRSRKPLLVLKPAPRRARSFYRERRPKFLVFRNPGFVG